jgi:RNA ligase (TIGR02306 family)
MARQLATIQRISEIVVIPNADNILAAKILGWHVVVRKADNFSVGDLVVYCEVDSLMPQTPEFEFLKDTNYRIRTRRFRQQISQGICFPLKILNGKKFSTDTRDNPVYELTEGMDVSAMLGVVKYEPPILPVFPVL